jgi:hypothetical protein
MSIGYRFYRATIKGLCPILMHNVQLADPSNPFTKALKSVTSKRKKTEADLEEMANIEWRGGLYTNHAGEIILPSRVLEAVIAKGATKSKEGKQALSGVFVESDGVFNYRGQGKSIDEMCINPEFRLTVGVNVSQKRIMRTRPIFHDWSATFELSASTEVVTDSATILRWLRDAGAFIGVGDYRPRYGRFIVDSFDELKQELKAAA